MAAQEACLLHELLRMRAEESDPLAGLAPAFFAEAATLIETPWALAAVPDLAQPETEGQRPEDLHQMLEFGEVRRGSEPPRRPGRRRPQAVV